jgi:hypothetical protein
MAPAAQLGHRAHPIFEWEQCVDAEAIHSEIRAGRKECLEVLEIGGVAAVADDHP